MPDMAHVIGVDDVDVEAATDGSTTVASRFAFAPRALLGIGAKMAPIVVPF